MMEVHDLHGPAETAQAGHELDLICLEEGARELGRIESQEPVKQSIADVASGLDSPSKVPLPCERFPKLPGGVDEGPVDLYPAREPEKSSGEGDVVRGLVEQSSASGSVSL